MMTAKQIIRRLKAQECKFTDTPFDLLEDMFRLSWPEPARGPWYWRNSQWNRWSLYIWWFTSMIKKGNWTYSLAWLYPDSNLPEMIHSNPKKAFIEALRRFDHD